MLSSHGCCVRTAETAVGQRSEINATRREINVDRVECARMPGAEPDTNWVHSVTGLIISREIEC